MGLRPKPLFGRRCRDKGVVFRGAWPGELSRHALWRFAADDAFATAAVPALAFQRRLSSGRPSRSCAVKLSLPRLPPPPVATAAPKAQVRRGSQPPRFNDRRLPTAPTPSRAAIRRVYRTRRALASWHRPIRRAARSGRAGSMTPPRQIDQESSRSFLIRRADPPHPRFAWACCAYSALPRNAKSPPPSPPNCRGVRSNCRAPIRKCRARFRFCRAPCFRPFRL